MPEHSPKILLDTHVWIWLMEGDSRLSSEAQERIKAAVPGQGIGVSAITTWEVAMLEAKGRITFDLSCQGWVSRGLQAPGISLLPLLPEIAVSSASLPGTFHGDPADRILVATARHYAVTLITADRAIKDYGSLGYVRVFSAV